MAKYYTTIRVTVELHKKIIKAKGRLEMLTGENQSIEKTLDKALNGLLSQ